MSANWIQVSPSNFALEFGPFRLVPLKAFLREGFFEGGIQFGGFPRQSRPIQSRQLFFYRLFNCLASVGESSLANESVKPTDYLFRLR